MMIKGFYFHIENGGLTLTLDQDKKDGLQHLTLVSNHYGNTGATSRVPLLTEDFIDKAIELLEEAKKNVKPDHSYDLDDGTLIKKSKK